MGCATGGDHDDQLSRSPCNRRRAKPSNGAIHLLAGVEHGPIFFRSHYRLYIPPILNPEWPKDSICLPHTPDHLPPASSRNLLVTCVTLRLRQSRTHRLPDLHPRQVMQAPPGHGPAPDHLPQEIPTVQVRCCPDGHSRCCNFQSAPPRN